ncbi:hypothetical protein Cgig2_018751 [Carnegiea gigantea]|uniref:Uncharacterized protein n=1 Tax=Carnegiea gigantea TaxID=171969 RepID=A0A9Q1JFF3_9CARY|nr:hypothetical protein Cgig2_018751 [Carnegiea gigantea]
MAKVRRGRPCLAQYSCLHTDSASPVALDQDNASTSPQSAHEQTEVVCKKKDGTRKEWRVKQPVQAMTQGNTVPVTQPKGGQIDSFADYTPQYIHFHAMQMSTNVKFYITFVCGLNQLQLRKKLWANLNSSQPLYEPCYIIRDFNSILYKEDRIRGEDALVQDIRDMRDFMKSCELQEMRSIGPYYSWTNKTIMSRIDRARTNDSLKPKMQFQYCDMWAKHANFSSMISSAKPSPSGSYTLKQLNISLLQQQCKLEWITYGGTSSKLFFAKAKQRKLPTYIYSVKDANGNWVEGFDNVAKVMVEFYKSLLGHQSCTRTSTVGLRESSFPLHYLGVPTMASKLTKAECAHLVDKLTAKVHQWAIRNISYAGRLALINSILFGMFNYWHQFSFCPMKSLKGLPK